MSKVAEGRTRPLLVRITAASSPRSPMPGLELAVVLLTVAAALRVLSRRLNIPHPVLLVLAGLALAAIPGLPRIELDPETLFLLFVPPLLYLTAFTTSLRDFRAQLGPIARYGTIVVLLTIGA